MAVLQYIGARYVPNFYMNSDGNSEWRSGVEYEALTIVTWNSNSYTSRIPVPVGVGNPSDNPQYWVETGQFNQQVSYLTNEVSELSDRMDAVEGIVGQTYPPINIMALGAKNDGTEDVGAIINQYTEQFPIYLPVGEYLVTTPIILKNSLVGADVGSARGYIRNTKCSKLVNGLTSGAVITINENADPHTISIVNIDIQGNDQPVTGILYQPAVRVQINIRQVGISGVQVGLNLNPSVVAPAMARIDGLRLYGIYDANQQAAIMDSFGIINNANTVDNHFINVDIFGFKVGMRLLGTGGHLLNMINIYPPNGTVSAENKELYYTGCACVEAYGNVTADLMYLDTAYQCWVQRSGYAQIGKAFSWFDGWDVDVNTQTGFVFSTRDTGRITVDSYFVGGSPYAVQGVAVGNVIINALKNMTNRQSTLRKDCLWTMPIGKYIKGPGCQYQYTPNGHFFECARIPLNEYGMVVFSVTFGVEYAILQLVINSNLTVNGLRKLNTPIYNYYYKVVDNVAIIYMEYPGSGTMGTVNPNVEVLQYGGNNNGVVSPICHNFSPISQGNNSGLTPAVT